MNAQQIAITTADGLSQTFICHPKTGGPHPVVLFLMDAPGIREELRDMARRLAGEGYYVMLPNLYYRAGVMELGPLPQDPEAPARKRAMDLMYSLTIPLVLDDLEVLIEHADRDPAADASRMGTVGYCMSGQFAINAAARFPDRVKAAASIHGTFLVTDVADSPHLAARRTGAELYFACAEIDRWFPAERVEPLARDLADHGVDARVELYPGVEHGFVFPQRPAYDAASAERHWDRLLDLFGRRLAAG